MEKNIKEKQKRDKRYITGFDGIRSIAVIGVILYHLLPTSMKGGYLGVVIFLAVSGYLITDLLIQEWESNGRIAIWQFYVRRMRRLYPAMVGMFLFATTYITIFQRNLLQDLRQIIISSLLYVNNWWQISNGLSYFDRFANESPFTHIWSLAVEGQNYLIWPILFIILIRVFKTKSKIFKAVFSLAALSAILMALLYQPNADPTRVYYGTDTRVFSILVGSALAFIWPSLRLKQEVSLKAKRILDVIGITSLVLVVLGLFVLDNNLSFVYYGGMFVYSILAALLVAITAHPAASLNKWLTNPMFDWIGKRSYGIYLYQFPIMIFYESKVSNLNDWLWLHTIVELVLILGASELSYRYIEGPLRHYDYQAGLEKIRHFIKHPEFTKSKLVYLPLLLALVVSLVGLAIAPANVTTAEQTKLQEQIAANKKLAEKTKNQEPAESEQPLPEPAASNPYGLTDEEIAAAQTMEVSAFGDSLILNAASDLQQIFPNIIVDGDIGRQLYKSPSIITDMANNSLLKDKVIVSLGTNGPFSEAQFDEVMAAFGDRQIYWLNLRLPTRRWENEVNQMLAKMADKYENLTLLDWYAESQGHDNWFYDDRVHPNPEGAIAYCSLIAKTVLTDN